MEDLRAGSDRMGQQIASLGQKLHEETQDQVERGHGTNTGYVKGVNYKANEHLGKISAGFSHHDELHRVGASWWREQAAPLLATAARLAAHRGGCLLQV